MRRMSWAAVVGVVVLAGTGMGAGTGFGDGNGRGDEERHDGACSEATLRGAYGLQFQGTRPVRPPFPPGIESFIGIAGFAATLAYLAYRRGKETGYKSGNVAATATARNVAEGRIPEPAPQVSLQPPYPPPP